jgi:hypothetical protein
MIKMCLGVDPGKTNCGISLLRINEDKTFSLVKAETLDTSSFTSMSACADYICNTFTEGKDIHYVTLERFVSFGGTSPSVAEDINILVGSILGILHYRGKINSNQSDPSVLLVRSIEWKTALVKTLVKTRGFDNPSSSGLLDKKFSMAAAACILGLDKLEKGVNNHEADAICVAAFPILCGNT